MLTQDVINLLNYVLLVSAVQEADLAYRNPQRHAFETILRNLDRTSSRLLHPEVLDFVDEVLVTSLVEIFRSDVGQVVLSRNLVDADIFLLHETRSTTEGGRGCNNFVPVLRGNGTKIDPTGDIFDQPPGAMCWIQGKLADHVGDHVVLSPEEGVLVISPGTKSSYPRLPLSLTCLRVHGCRRSIAPRASCAH